MEVFALGSERQDLCSDKGLLRGDTKSFVLTGHRETEVLGLARLGSQGLEGDFYVLNASGQRVIVSEDEKIKGTVTHREPRKIV